MFETDERPSRILDRSDDGGSALESRLVTRLFAPANKGLSRR